MFDIRDSMASIRHAKYLGNNKGEPLCHILLFFKWYLNYLWSSFRHTSMRNSKDSQIKKFFMRLTKYNQRINEPYKCLMIIIALNELFYTNALFKYTSFNALRSLGKP